MVLVKMSEIKDNNPETQEPPVAPELAELVAYLDGELDEGSVERVERRLVEEPPLRMEADRLDRTWQLLDSLSEVTAGSEFTRRTLSSIHSVVLAPTAADGSTITDSQHPMPKPVPAGAGTRVWQLITSFALSFLLCGGVILLVEWIRFRDRPADEVQILQNLDVLRNFFQVNRIPDEEFLKDLDVRLPEDGSGPPALENQP